MSWAQSVDFDVARNKNNMNKNTSYHPFAKLIHWTIVVLVVVLFVSGELMPILRGSDIPNYFKITHLALGLLVIPFAVTLLYMRFSKPVARPETDDAGKLIRWATIGTHYLLYALLILVPLSGWASASIRNMKISFLGVFDFPLAQAGDPSFIRMLGGVHGELATLIGIVALGHMLAALYHHFVLKDSVFNRMRPETKA